MTRRTNQRGFSLIEALVALIIAALVLSGVLELQRQLASGQARYQRTLELANLERNAFALMANINPAQTPDGQLDLGGGRRLLWTASPRGVPTLNTGAPVPGRRFQLQLYSVSATIIDRDGRSLGVLGFERVGWRKLAKPQPYVAPAPPPPKPSPPAPLQTGPVL